MATILHFRRPSVWQALPTPDLSWQAEVAARVSAWRASRVSR